jgi:hypothetical protein
MSASKLCAMLDGIQTLHESMRESAASEDFLEKHHGLIKAELMNTQFHFEDAAVVIAKLKLMLVWSPDKVSDLIKIISQQVFPRTANIAARKAAQDYSCFPLHLTEDIWETLQCTQLPLSTKVKTVCEHLASLGLRSASEPTCAMILLVTTQDIETLDQRTKYYKLQEIKSQVKLYLDAYSIQQVGPILEKLPEDRLELKSYGFTCFEKLTSCKIDWTSLVVAHKQIPLRISNKGVREDRKAPPTSSSSSVANPQTAVDLMGMMAGFLRSMQNKDQPEPKITILGFADKPKPEAVADASSVIGSKLALPPPADHAAIPSATPALQDGTLDKTAPKQQSPLQVIEMLKGSGGKVLKRPAASSKESSAKVKPAKSIGSKKTKAKENLFSDLPSPELRKKLKPKGCSKCRERPGCCDSCWKGRKKTW